MLVCCKIFSRFDAVYTADQIKHAVADEHYTTKLVTKIMRARNDELRDYWQAHLQNSLTEIPSYMYVVVDESHLSPKELERRYGRSFVGYPAYIRSRITPDDPHQFHVDPCCAVAAISIEGMLSVSTLKINTHDTFLRILEDEIFPLMNPFPGPKSILMMDNASPHFKADVLNLCEAHGIIALFLPPYSYDLSPIEPIFHLAKAYIRRKWGIFYAYSPLAEQFTEALWSCCPPNIACNEFNHVGITVTQWERAWAGRN